MDHILKFKNTCTTMYCDPTRMKEFGTSNLVSVDVIHDKPCFQMYNFELLTKEILSTYCIK